MVKNFIIQTNKNDIRFLDLITYCTFINQALYLKAIKYISSTHLFNISYMILPA